MNSIWKRRIIFLSIFFYESFAFIIRMKKKVKQFYYVIFYWFCTESKITEFFITLVFQSKHTHTRRARHTNK